MCEQAPLLGDLETAGRWWRYTHLDLKLKTCDGCKDWKHCPCAFEAHVIITVTKSYQHDCGDKDGDDDVQSKTTYFCAEFSILGRDPAKQMSGRLSTPIGVLKSGLVILVSVIDVLQRKVWWAHDLHVRGSKPLVDIPLPPQFFSNF